MQRASQVVRLLRSSWWSSRPRASPGCLSTPSCAGSQRHRERAAVGLAATAAAALVVAVALSHPLARLHSFAKPPVASDTPSFVRTHLVSGSGSGRWQFWTAAVDQWQSAPVVGAGAGTFAAWWAEHGSLALFVRNAHSLYLESLGELGAVGFLLASAVWVGGCAIGVRACRRLDGEERTSLAGATAVALAFGVGAGVDWLWQLPAVSLVGVSALALALGPPVRERAPAPPLGRARRARVARSSSSWCSSSFRSSPAMLLRRADGPPRTVDHWLRVTPRSARTRSSRGRPRRFSSSRCSPSRAGISSRRSGGPTRRGARMPTTGRFDSSRRGSKPDAAR